MSLVGGDLTTVLACQTYLDSSPAAPILSGLVTRISAMVRSAINRNFVYPRAYSQVFNGTGTNALVLPEWPLLSVSSLSINGSALSLSPQPTVQQSFSLPYGYRAPIWDGLPPGAPSVLELTGGAFYIGGNQNVVIGYTAGYQVTESATVPATPFQYTPVAPYGSWATDVSVTYTTTGVALVAKPAGTTLAAGQYIPPDPNTPRPYYTFDSADVGLVLTITYGFIPADLEQVVIELIAERASYRRRVGLRSQMLGGQETMSYDTHGLPDYARQMLMPYTSTLPPVIGASV